MTEGEQLDLATMGSRTSKQTAPRPLPRPTRSCGEPPTLARLLCEATSHAVLLIDHHGWIREVVGPAVLFQPARPDDLVGRRLSAFLHRGDRSRVDHALARVFPEPGAIRQLTVRRRTSGGSWRTIELTLVNHMDVPEVAGLLAIFTELADGDLATAILGALSDGVLLLDESGRTLAANPSAERLLGLSADALIRRPLAELFGPLAPASRVAGEEIAAGSWESHAEVRRPAGSSVELRLRGHALAPPARLRGQPVRQVVTLAAIPPLASVGPGSRSDSSLGLRDTATGLPGEALLLDRLQQALARARREAAQIAVIRFEIPALAELRRRRGDGAHDEVLGALVQQALTVARASDTLARLPDGSLCLVCFPVDDQQHARVIAARVAQRLDPAHLDPASERSRGTVRTGVALSTNETTSPDALLTAAADALACAATSPCPDDPLVGPPLVAIPSPVERDPHSRDKARELRRAVARQEFVVRLQPEVRLRDGRISGARVAPYWLHPRSGPIALSELSALADSHGLTMAIGNAVFEHACWHAADLRRRHGDRAVPLRIAISSRQLAQADFVCVVRRALERSGAAARQISLVAAAHELRVGTDGAIAFALLDDLRQMGLGLTLGGFGGTDSPLELLRRGVVDAVELDPALLPAEHAGTPRIVSRDLTLLAGMMSLAKALGLATVATGIATAAQAAQLRELGCQIGVGPGLGLAVTPERFAASLGRRRPRPEPHGAGPS